MLDELDALDLAAAASPECQVVICVPSVLIPAAASRVRHIAIGAQDCHYAIQGAFTGEVSAEMLAEASAKWVLVGHSERRRANRSSNAEIALKAEAAVRAGLRPIVCVGEERKMGVTEAAAAVVRQLEESLPGSRDGGIVVAYEPVWAIGSGTTPAAHEIAAVLGAIKTALVERGDRAGSPIPVLYGGSVGGDNVDALARIAELDGLLVGGASLSAASFVPLFDLANGWSSDIDMQTRTSAMSR